MSLGYSKYWNLEELDKESAEYKIRKKIQEQDLELEKLIYSLIPGDQIILSFDRDEGQFFTCKKPIKDIVNKSEHAEYVNKNYLQSHTYKLLP